MNNFFHNSLIDSRRMIRESDEITTARVYLTTATFFPVVRLSVCPFFKSTQVTKC